MMSQFERLKTLLTQQVRHTVTQQLPPTIPQSEPEEQTASGRRTAVLEQLKKIQTVPSFIYDSSKAVTVLSELHAALETEINRRQNLDAQKAASRFQFILKSLAVLAGGFLAIVLTMVLAEALLAIAQGSTAVQRWYESSLSQIPPEE